MWINRSEWVVLLTAAHENKVRKEMADGTIKGLEEKAADYRDRIRAFQKVLTSEKEKNALLSARVSTLENKLLEMNEKLNQVNRQVQVPQPVDITALYEEEDQEQVNAARARIKAEGADIILAEMVEM